ncbi:hypothetical protein P7K49_013304 [Saguinus oedipus]|uniref:Uncharacterized protein n=1 Tax=Saguinus oedipus TaxID=9490 RepID=A0ABQ9VFJ9_SAGOE|nr:hypothetical protein P7K49_013304 [Saguinus oedipus]
MLTIITALMRLQVRDESDLHECLSRRGSTFLFLPRGSEDTQPSLLADLRTNEEQGMSPARGLLLTRPYMHLQGFLGRLRPLRASLQLLEAVVWTAP